MGKILDLVLVARLSASLCLCSSSLSSSLGCSLRVLFACFTVLGVEIVGFGM